MSLLPRSLLGRNALLLVVLIIIGQLLAGFVFRQFVQKPFLERLAVTLANDLIAVRAGLAQLPEAQRADFVAAFNGAARTQAPAPAAGPVVLPAERLLIGKASALLAAQGMEAVWRREAGGAFYVRVRIDDRSYWLSTAGLQTSARLPRAALVSWGIGMLLALLGAFLIQRRINRPLSQLVAGARAIGRGETATALAETGPREIAAVCRSFNDMQVQLREQERQRALMLAGVSHDLRTPLTKIRLAVEILGDGTQRTYTDSIVRSCDQIETIIGQFIDFAGAGSGETPVRTDVNQLIGELVATLEAPFRLQAGSLPCLLLRPQALRRALTNLMENALRYGRPDYAIVTEALDGQVRIRVRDHGPGIAPERSTEVLQPFTRGSAARDGPAGAGLGLAIAARMVQLDRGSLELLQPPDGGLEVCLTFPAS